MLKDHSKRDACKGEVSPLLASNHKTRSGTGYVLPERGKHESSFYKERSEGSFRLAQCFIVRSSNLERSYLPLEERKPGLVKKDMVVDMIDL
jgi:hypothetical protein